MNPWLLSAAALLGVIGIVHSLMGEQRIFRPWAVQPPRGVRPFHQRMLRCTWHLPSLLGFGQAAALAWLGAAAADRPAAGLQQALLASLGGGVLACGLLVIGMTRGRHQGGTALAAAAILIFIGLVRTVAS